MTRIINYTLVLLMLTGFITACARKMNFAQSVVVPSAEGNVKIKKDKNNNYNIQVSVSHLADPGKLQPPKETYVVWVETRRNGVKNLGQLIVSDNLKGSLTSVSPFEPSRVFITAEEAANVEYPGLQTVLTTK